jgi:phytoene dehydrogenase-like protein
MALRERRVVVIGASMAGLLAARVLADRFDEVTVVERDDLSGGRPPVKAFPRAGMRTHS